MAQSVVNTRTCEVEIESEKANETRAGIFDVRFQIENKWEGIVLDVKKNIVFAKMKDVSTGEDYEFDFKINDVNKDDRGLIAIGALFNFYTGYTLKGKTRKNDKLIKFRRQVTTQNKINSILEKMKEMNLNDLIEIY